MSNDYPDRLEIADTLAAEIIADPTHRNWSYFSPRFQTARVMNGQYGPYWMWGVKVNQAGVDVDYTWFLNQDSYKRALMAGATQNSLMQATNHSSGGQKPKRTLEIKHNSGPIVVRNEQQADEIIALDLASLNGDAPAPTQSAPPAATVAQPPQKPGVPPPAPPPQQPVVQPPQPPQSPQRRTYRPLEADDLAFWKAASTDRAMLVLWNYHNLSELNEQAGYPKIKEADRRELAATISLGVLRDYGDPRGWRIDRPRNKEEVLDALVATPPQSYSTIPAFVEAWMRLVAEPYGLDHWHHAANIAKILGASSDDIYNENSPDEVIRWTTMIWFYLNRRAEGKERKEVLDAVAEKFHLLRETLKDED